MDVSGARRGPLTCRGHVFTGHVAAFVLPPPMGSSNTEKHSKYDMQRTPLSYATALLRSTFTPGKTYIANTAKRVNATR